MDWLAGLEGQVVGVDTAPFIYMVEENPEYLETVSLFSEAVERLDFRVVTSTVTLVEVLVHPYRQGRSDLAVQYREILLNSNGISCVPLSDSIAEEAALMRSQHNLQTPDAIQLATASHEGARWFLTNDTQLHSIPPLSILLLDQIAAQQSE